MKKTALKRSKKGMKRPAMNKIGKRTKANMEAIKEMHSTFRDKKYCEAKLKGCLGDQFLSYHHWPKKSTGFYISQPWKLSDFNYVLKVCQSCHDKLDGLEREKNEEIFKRERDEQIQASSEN